MERFNCKYCKYLKVESLGKYYCLMKDKKIDLWSICMYYIHQKVKI